MSVALMNLEVAGCGSFQLGRCRVGLLSWGGGGGLPRKLSRPEDGCYRPKHVVFTLLINTII